MNHDATCSVLVPVFNEERYIEESVAAMTRQQYHGELEFLFADGGSADSTVEILRRLGAQDPRIRVLSNPRRTVSSGLNVALRHACGRWAARMDAHTVYPANYVALGVDRLSRGGTRWVSGPQIPVGHNRVSRAVSLALSCGLGRGGSRKWGTGLEGSGDEFDLDTGVFAGVWERATLLHYGGWDERWTVNEDSEMAARFLARGERLVCLPAMAARYTPRDTFGGLWRQYLRYGEFRARTAKQHPRSMRASHLLAPGVVAVTASAVVAPGRARRTARLGIIVYGVTVTSAGIDALRAAPSPPPSEAALVPVVLAVMHVAHGLGQWVGWVRFRPPVDALAALVRLGHPDEAPRDDITC